MEELNVPLVLNFPVPCPLENASPTQWPQMYNRIAFCKVLLDINIANVVYVSQKLFMIHKIKHKVLSPNNGSGMNLLMSFNLNIMYILSVRISKRHRLTFIHNKFTQKIF